MNAPAIEGFKPLPGARFCCVVGSPIVHSRSPLVHRIFAEQFGLALHYEKFEVKAGELDKAVLALRALGCIGLNATVPLKEEACGLASYLTPRAARAKAANTLWWDIDARLSADNTDGLGLINDLTLSRTLVIRNSRILLLGAGGAAAGVIPALLDAEPASIVIVNRTHGRAQALLQRFEMSGRLSVSTSEATFTKPFDLVINATAASVASSVPVVGVGAIGPGTVCYDMFYSREETTFLRWARAQGARRCRDGLGMLIEQAAAAFFRWHGRNPDTAPVFAALGRPISSL